MLDKTMIFSLGGDRDDEIKVALTTVYDALRKKGYNPTSLPTTMRVTSSARLIETTFWKHL